MSLVRRSRLNQKSKSVKSIGLLCLLSAALMSCEQQSSEATIDTPAPSTQSHAEHDHEDEHDDLDHNDLEHEDTEHHLESGDAHHLDEHEHEHEADEHNELHDEHEHVEHNLDDHSHNEHSHAGHNHDIGRIKFNCEPEQVIEVYYHDDIEPQSAHLLIDGIEYDLIQDINADTHQKTYRSDIGLDEAHGLSWHSANQQASLMAYELEQKDTQANEEVLFECEQAEQLGS